MKHLIKNFVSYESGAVTVDWVVLTAVTLGFGMAVGLLVIDGVEDLSNDTNAVIDDIDPTQSPFATDEEPEPGEAGGA